MSSKYKVGERLVFFLVLLSVILSCNQNTDTEANSSGHLVRYKRQVKNITYYFPASTDKDVCNNLISSCESAVWDNLKLINESSFTDSVDIEFLSSRKEMLKYTGMAASGMAFPERKTMFSLTDLKEAPVKHELMHLITMLKWGVPHPGSIWMNEGLATYADNNCNNYNVEQIYRYLISKSSEIPVDSLAANFYGQSEMISYHQSAFIVQYLLNHYGIARFKNLWKNGFYSFPQIYKCTFAQILPVLNETVKNHYPKIPDIDWNEFKKGCN